MPALTSLRFLAAAIVFLHHFPPTDAWWPLAIVAGQGHVGVTVFFVLSGFLITVRYSGALGGGPDGVTMNDYFRKRVARIVPLYWAVLGTSLLLANGTLGLAWHTVPEWVLLQGFLSRSIEDLAVPTSWTLTLEECFYATAPLLFLGVRRARGHGARVLLAWTIALLCLGLGVGQIVEPERFQFLGSASQVLRHTFFGRFADFALGVWGGRLFLSGAVGRTWARPRGPLAATAVGLAGIAFVFAGQAGMTFAGPLDSPRWLLAWPFNLLVAAGSLVLILALTSRASVLTRVLSLPPLVYLGRVSYALYLIQLTPLGKGLFYRLIPADTPGFGWLLYAGMTLMSALLYELVEEPGRRAVLRVWHGGGHSRKRPASLRRGQAWAFVLVIAVVASVQTVAWAGAHAAARRGLPTLAEAKRAAGSLRDRSVALPAHLVASRETVDGTSYRVPIPDTWMIGPEADQRAPPSLLVFADGRAVPFERRAADVASSPAGAHYRGPRTTFVELRVPAEALPSEITLVRHDHVLAGRLLAHRIAAAPRLLVVIALALTGGILAAWLFYRRWRPGVRGAASLALVAGALFILCDLHAQTWAPLVIAVELTGLCALSLVKASARDRSGSTGDSPSRRETVG